MSIENISPQDVLQFNFKGAKYSFSDIRNLCIDELNTLQTQVEEDMNRLPFGNHPLADFALWQSMFFMFCLHNFISCVILNKRGQNSSVNTEKEKI